MSYQVKRLEQCLMHNAYVMAGTPCYLYFLFFLVYIFSDYERHTYWFVVAKCENVGKTPPE